MKRTAKAASQSAVNLLFFALLGTAVLAFTYNLTHERIHQTEEAEKLKLITQVLPPALFDNNIMQDTLSIPADKQLGTTDTTTAYRARLKGEPSAVVLESIAPDGYSGNIYLIVGILANGEVAGVRVVSHKETPGLGDYIELPKSPWIQGFDGKSRTNYSDADWHVKKDGGKFDYMAGATITPRAVVKAVNKTLQYYAENRERLFAATSPQPATGGKQ